MSEDLGSVEVKEEEEVVDIVRFVGNNNSSLVMIMMCVLGVFDVLLECFIELPTVLGLLKKNGYYVKSRRKKTLYGVLSM